MKKYLSLIAVLTLALGANDVYAASAVGTGTATATIIDQVKVTQKTPMNFGNLLSSTSEYTVTLNAANSGRASSDSDVSLVGGGTVSAGEITISGQSGLSVTASIGSSAKLKNGSNELTLDNFTVSGITLGQSTTLTNSSLTFKVGGKLTVPASAPAGTYTGDYTVTVSY